MGNGSLVRWIKRIIGIALIVLFGYLTIEYFEWDRLRRLVLNLIQTPTWLGVMVITYGVAFLLKSWVWNIYVGRYPLKVFWIATHFGLFFNHLLPFKTGDLVRAGSLKHQLSLSWERSIQSVAMMRVFDLISLASIAGLGLVFFVDDSSLFIYVSVILALFLVLLIPFRNKQWGHFILRQVSEASKQLLSIKGMLMLALVLLSWILEGFVVLAVAVSAGVDLSFLESVWTTAMSVVSGIFQVTPGNISGYESVMSSTLRLTGVEYQIGYEIALVTHLFKFVYAYGVGSISFLQAPISPSSIRGWLNRKE